MPVDVVAVLARAASSAPPWVGTVPPLPTAGHGPGHLSLWVSAPVLVGLVWLALWLRRR